MEIEALLLEQIRSARSQRRLAGILLLVIAVGGLILFLTGTLQNDGTRKTAKAFVYSVLGIPLGLGLILSTLRDPRRQAALVTLRESPKNVVWAYLSIPHRATWMSKPSLRWMAQESSLILHTDAKQRLTLPVRAGEEQKVQAAVRAALPQAAHGFSPALEAQYRTNPASLKRA